MLIEVMQQVGLTLSSTHDIALTVTGSWPSDRLWHNYLGKCVTLFPLHDADGMEGGRGGGGIPELTVSSVNNACIYSSKSSGTTFPAAHWSNFHKLEIKTIQRNLTVFRKLDVARKIHSFFFIKYFLVGDYG